jgi:hypothetical protein
MENVMTYLDDLLILTNSSFKDHLLKWKMVLARLSTAGMRVKISKSKFFAEQVEYLASWYWITRQGIQPIGNKDEMIAILNIKVPKTRNNNKLLQFIGIVNYYRDVWFRKSQLLALFHWLASHQARSSLNGTHRINGPLIKSRKSLELRWWVLLCYPDFNRSVFFHLYTDASDHQLGAVIMQDKKPIAFHSRILNTAQKRYTNIERNRELLSAIETCKLQAIQEYPIRLPWTYHSLYRP